MQSFRSRRDEAISQVVRGNRGFLAFGVSLNRSLLGKVMSRRLPACLCLEDSRSRRMAETGSMTGWWVPNSSPTGSTIQSFFETFVSLLAFTAPEWGLFETTVGLPRLRSASLAG
jgi:hypothetical protein